MLYDELSTREAASSTPVAAEPFACGFHAEGRGAAWVSARGELDLASAPQFTQALDQALEQALLVIVDLRALTFIDSTGIHAIVNADAQARQTGHRLVLIRGSGQVARVFALTGLSDRLRIVDLTPGHPATHTILEASATDAAC